MDRIKQNGRRVLISLLKRNHQPIMIEETLRKIANKGTPLKPTNNNYWTKKVGKYISLKEEKKNIDLRDSPRWIIRISSKKLWEI